MKSYRIERVYLSDRTLGSFYIDNEVVAKTLELPWRNNSRSISCIPEGKYIVRRNPPKPDRPYSYFRFDKVHQRSGILIHRGVKPIHSRGCILVGSRFSNIESNEPILESSGVKLQWLVDNLPEDFVLEITKKTLTV